MNLRPHFRRLLAATILTALPQISLSQTPAAPPPSTISAASTAPFLSLTHDEALARTKAENKPLLLFFDGHWSERAREVLPEIFSDPTVATAINDHALALRINVLTAPELTKQYKIFHVPTIIWLYPDGTARRYWVNCEKPSDIRDEIVESLTLLPKLRAATRPDDPLGRLKLARAFFEAGDYAAALTETRWLYLDALGDTSSTKAKKEKDRVSAWEVIKFLEELRPFYEPARATIREFIEREEQKTRANPKSGIAAAKFWRLARILGETHLIATLHDSLPPGPARDTLARQHPKPKKSSGRPVITFRTLRPHISPQPSLAACPLSRYASCALTSSAPFSSCSRPPLSCDHASPRKRRPLSPLPTSNSTASSSKTALRARYLSVSSVIINCSPAR